MRILAVSQYYWPEPFNVSEICEELVARGHSVTVLTGLPNYPEGELYSGYEKRQKRVENRNGVKIIRSWLWPRKTGALNRLLNYESFCRSASRLARKLDDDFDIVLSFEISPVMSAEPAIAYARRMGCPLLIYVIDIWPECLLSGGVAKDSAIYKHYAKVSRRIYSSADRLAITSPLFRNYIEELLGHEIDAFDLPQYAEEIFEGISPSAPKGYRPDRVNLTFAGNVGSAQSVQTIVKAAAALKGEPVLFHIVGSGSELDACKRLSRELGAENVIFHGRHPLEEMPAYYGASDAMLATFADNPILGYTLPRKVQSYMAAGKPILGTLTGESRRVIDESQCGLCCDAGDEHGLASVVRRFLCLSDAEKAEMGSRAKSYNEAHFSRKHFFEKLETELISMKEGSCELGQ